MEALTDIWGLTLNQTLLLLALILIIIDIFIPTDVPTHIAYVLLCTLVGINIPFHFLIKILGGLTAYFGLILFHYFVWRATMQKFVNTVLAPDKFHAGAKGIVGYTGVIRKIGEKQMVKVKGDLWPCRGADKLSDGTRVWIDSAENGLLNVKKEGS